MSLNKKDSKQDKKEESLETKILNARENINLVEYNLIDQDSKWESDIEEYELCNDQTNF